MGNCASFDCVPTNQDAEALLQLRKAYPKLLRLGGRPLAISAACLVLSNTRRGWAGVPRRPLGRKAAPLARCSPPTALTILGPACCAGRHPSCPFTLSGSSVGQRGILRSIHLLSCTYNTSYVRILMLFDIFPVVRTQVFGFFF
jgi:hypothetical protein